MQDAQSFQYTVNEDSIALITFDMPNEKINKLASHVMKEFHALIHELKARGSLKGAILFSAKKNIFIAGADIREIGAAKGIKIQAGKDLLRMGHEIFYDLSHLPFPTCVAMDGVCLGGGMELALACDYRIATLNPKTLLALPEVTLGVMPGWGGSQRMPRLIGAAHALDLICSGRYIGGQEAYEIGLTDDYCQPEALTQSALQWMKGVIQSSEWKKRREKLNGPLEMNEDEAASVFKIAREKVYNETKGLFPAPMIALEAVQEGSFLSLEEGLKIELEKIDPLIGSEISQNLIHLFFSSEALKKVSWTKNKDIIPKSIDRVAVLGAGIMGSGIAAANITRKIPTLMKDISQERVEKGVDHCVKILSGRVHKHKMSQGDMNHRLALLTGTQSDEGFKDCNLIIEAVVEDYNVKKQVFAEAEKHLSDTAILASNTTSISINKLSEGIKHKDRFIGLHFYNPVDKMTLVEIIRSQWTSDETVATVVQYVRKIGKTAIVVNDGVGFIVSRLLMLYLSEATILVEEGVDLQTIDRVMTNFGMPMGPLTLLDVIGIDTAYKASQVLIDGFPDRYVHSKVLELLTENNRLGQKSGMGFYKYKRKKLKGQMDETLFETLKTVRHDKKNPSDEAIRDRMLLPMILEGVRVLEDGVAESVRDVDMSMILGTGFPAFRGGLLRYADSVGIKEIIKRCKPFSDLGGRYRPGKMLNDMAQGDKTFYPS